MNFLNDDESNGFSLDRLVEKSNDIFDERWIFLRSLKKNGSQSFHHFNVGLWKEGSISTIKFSKKIERQKDRTIYIGHWPQVDFSSTKIFEN